MRLLNQVITKKLQEYHEAELNQKFTPETFYQTLSLCCVYLKQEIPNKQQIITLHNQLIKNILEENNHKIRTTQQQIKQNTFEHMNLIHKYTEHTKNIKQETETKDNIFNKYTLGILSYEDSA